MVDSPDAQRARAGVVNAYLATIDRMEPNITPVDLPAAAASIAISLKRIADAADFFVAEFKASKAKDEEREASRSL